jgi:hypothetical protein
LIAVYYNQPEVTNSATVTGWSRPPQWPHLISKHVSVEKFWNQDQYIAASCQTKIAIYQVEWGLGGDGVDQVTRETNNISLLSQHSDWVFVIEPEPHSHYLIPHSWSNVTWVTAGVLRDREADSASWQYHLWRMAVLYQHIPQALAPLRPYEEKPQVFDVLLGSMKPHRCFAWDDIQQRFIYDQVIMTMAGRPGWPDCIVEPDMEFVEQRSRDLHTESVRYHGHILHLPCVVPISIYNQTAYSVVAETDYDNDALIVTEKVAKPMIARRLFVVITGQGYLAYLRSLGFQTFGDVIDEGYDMIKHPETRWRAALDQVAYLCGCDQKQILHKIQPVVEHNYQWIMQNNFVESTLQLFLDRIRSFTH